MAVTAKADKFSFPRRSSSNFSTNKRNAEGNFADVQSDVVLDVDGVCFSLHKFPLSSRSGRIRKLLGDLEESNNASDSSIELFNFPGGPDTFELAAKFCYGINFEITTANVSNLRCAAKYLEMTDEYGEENLLVRTETFLKEVVLNSLEKSAEVLRACEIILPFAEELKIVSRCIDAIASTVCREQIVSSLSRLDCNSSGRSSEGANCKAVVEWWAEDLSMLRIDLYQRVLAAMKFRGLRNESLGGSLMHYAQRALKALNKKQGPESGGLNLRSSKTRLHSASGTKAMEHEQRILLETIVSLLPAEKNIVSTNFLLRLLRIAIILDTTVACRLDLEHRIGLQLEQATVDDLVIPSFSHAGDTMFDVDIVQRVLVTYLRQEESQDHLSTSAMYESDELGSPSRRGIMKVAKLIDMYLAEIAPDSNLKVSKFTSLAEKLPDYARVLDDGLYRAIDIFLKAHPTLSELERKKLCKLLDCQKLSQEACAHAAQNERLPVQLVVQVLYFEQVRMRNAIAGSINDDQQQHYHYQHHRRAGPVSCSSARPVPRMSANMSPRVDDYSNIRRENRELKVEVGRLRLRLNELERENLLLKEELEKPSSTAGSGSGSGFFASFSRRLGKMNPFASKPKESGKQQSVARSSARRRRHSIS